MTKGDLFGPIVKLHPIQPPSLGPQSLPRHSHSSLFSCLVFLFEAFLIRYGPQILQVINSVNICLCLKCDANPSERV